MKPATNTLSEIFQPPIRLMVPLYQRPYVWKQDDHWQPLWEDVESVLARHLAGDGDSIRHFLGAIVLDQQYTPPGEASRRLVIDGQQRLTTLQLLIAAAVRNAERDAVDQQARLLKKLIENDPDLATGDETFKVWPTNTDQVAFREVMGSGADATESRATSIYHAHSFFDQAIREWLDADAPSPENLEERHKALRITLSSLLQVVSINLEPGDNPQVIFETLNARGTPLLAMDLVKNAVFFGAQREKADVDRLNHEVWEPQLGDKYWRENVRQGRLNRPRAELFLMHWLAMKLGRIIPATELYAEFRAHILGAAEQSSTADLIDELCNDAAALRGFDSHPPGSVEEQFFRHLDALDTTTVIPVALLLYRSPEVTLEQRHTGLQALESWLVRRMLCGLATQAYNRLMADLLKVIKADIDHADDVIVEFLRSSDANSAIWPTDGMVISFLTTRYLYGYISQKRIVMVLSQVEMMLRRGNKVEDIYTLPKNLTVEHLMPQTWREHWPLPADSDPEQREAKINQLGNLTLTSGSLNSSLSNGPWEAKRPALLQHSLLALNQQVGTSENWDEESIKRRGSELAEQICGLWPGPEAQSWPGIYEPHNADNATIASSDLLATSASSPTSSSTSSTRVARDGRDITRYHVIVDGSKLPHENKRKTMLVMVTNLIERDVPAVAIGEELGSRFRSVEGELEDFLPAFYETYKTFDPAWWYTDHPFRQDGRTWLLDKGWGVNTEPALTALVKKFPQADVSFCRADPQ
jgi:hypothetical protein